MQNQSTSNENMQIWNAVFQTNPEYTKGYQGAGGFKGTAIDAMYNVQRATELFGPIGQGWGAQTVETKIVNGVWFSHVRLWYKHNGEIGEVFAWAGTKFSYTASSGKEIVDEEAAKKTQTDAMTKCLSWLGFSADVHMGMFDDNKYVNQLKAEEDAKKKAKAAEAAPAPQAKEPVPPAAPPAPNVPILKIPENQDDVMAWGAYQVSFYDYVNTAEKKEIFVTFCKANAEGMKGLRQIIDKHNPFWKDDYEELMTRKKQQFGVK